TLFTIENNLYHNFQKKSTNDEHLAYALLIKLLSPKASVYKTFFDSVALQYPSKPLNSLDSTALFGKDNTHTEWHFFYDDDDGKSSYNSFIASYRNAAWKIQDFTDYVCIKSVKGKKVIILANKPVYERSAPAKIDAYIKEHNLDVEVLVHRGHSFYVDNTLKHLQTENHLVVLGSCGGYHQVLDILETAPSAQIIATKQIGSYTVNDPLIYQFVGDINKGKTINWETFWTTLSKKFTKGSYGYDKFMEYVPPHKNLGAGFIQAFKSYQFGN
ncbi:MAG: hypothetical protein LRY27_03205, partial [Chitinophagales bacterium]|nr:hypothetical protein [Chitinophagales bacterium]